MEIFALEQQSAFQIAPRASSQIREVFKSMEFMTPKGQLLHSLNVSHAFLSQTNHFFIAGRNEFDRLHTAHDHYFVVESRPLRGSGQPVIRRMLRHNAIEAWEAIRKSDEWKRRLRLTSWRKKSKAFEVI